MEGQETPKTPEQPPSLRESLTNLTKYWEQQLGSTAERIRVGSTQLLENARQNQTNKLVHAAAKINELFAKGIANQYIEPVRGAVGFVRWRLEGQGEQQNG